MFDPGYDKPIICLQLSFMELVNYYTIYLYILMLKFNNYLNIFMKLFSPFIIISG